MCIRGDNILLDLIILSFVGMEPSQKRHAHQALQCTGPNSSKKMPHACYILVFVCSNKEIKQLAVLQFKPLISYIPRIQYNIKQNSVSDSSVANYCWRLTIFLIKKTITPVVLV